MKNNDFDKLIQDKALAHQSEVPADAWDNIQKNKRKRRFGFFWWLLPLLLIGSGLFGVYKYNESKHGANKENIVATKNNANKKETNANDVRGNNNASIVESNVTETGNDKNIPQANDVASSQNTNSNKDVKTAADNNINYISTNKKKNKTAEKDAENIIDGKNKKDIVNNKKQLLTKNVFISKKGKADAVVTSNLLSSKRNKNANSKTKMTITPATAMADDNGEETVIGNKIAETEKEKNDQSDKKVTASIAAQVVKEAKKDSTATVTTLAKKDDKKEKKMKNLFIDISVSPFMPLQSKQKLLGIERTTTGTDYKTVFKTDEINNRLDPSIAFTISLRKEFNKKWGASVGVQYAKVKETIKLTGKETTTKYNYIKRLDPTGSRLIDDTVQVITQGIRNIDAVNSYDFLTIPVGVQYKLYQRNKWGVAANSAVNVNMVTYKNSIQGKLDHNYASAASTAKSNSKVTADVYAGLRVTRVVNKKVQVFAEPFMQLNLMKYNMPDMINNKNMHRAGLNVGLSVSF